MRGKNKLKHRLIIGLCLCLAMIVVLASYAAILQNELNQDTIDKLGEVSEQTIKGLNNKIDSEFALLQEIGNTISVQENFDPQVAVTELKKVAKRHSVKRMGIIMADGTSYTTDNANPNLRDRQYFRESIAGKRYVSTRLMDKKSQDTVIVYSLPVYEGEDVCAVLFVAYDIEEIQKTMEVTAFGGEGYAYVVTRSGNAVIDSGSENGFPQFTNVFKSLRETSNDNQEAAEKLRKEMLSGDTGYVSFFNKVEKYMYYEPLGVNNWYVLSVVPTGVMDSTRNFIMIITYVVISILVAVFLVLLFYIIRAENQKKKEMECVLYIDNVTGGYSYARFCKEAQKILRNSESKIAYISMDIDKFKIVNELYGYEEGNKTLRFVWKIWKECSRQGEIFARFAADRFVALWFYKEREELETRIAYFQELLQQGVQQKQAEYNLHTTLGIYLIKDKNEDIQKMMNYAIMAGATVKGREDKDHEFFDDDFKNKLLQKKSIEDQMKSALQHEEFMAYYQPKFDAISKEMVGAEALIRWKKKDGTMVMPGQFIPIAEQNGLIHKLDRYIFREVCRQQKEWLDEGKKIVPISVNLSQNNLYNLDLINEYKDVITKVGLPPQYVQLELTESVFFENQQLLKQIIDRLHQFGFRILMDDFGTGYSSLLMLKSVPIDVLKLDKSFVDDFDDSRGEKIIKSVIRLAQALEIEVTAEGVETQEQYHFLKNLGCDMVQGFYFAKPMSAEAFKSLMN